MNISNDQFPNLTDIDKLDLSLISKEILGCLTGIIGYSILLLSAYGSRDLILQRAMNRVTTTNEINPTAATTRSTNSSNMTTSPTPSEIAAISGWISLFTNILLGTISFARLREREIEIQNGTDKNPLYPNINIAVGYICSILGSIIRAIGSQQRSGQSALAIR